MRKNPAIVDTNVVVSGLMSTRKDAPPVRIFDSMMDGSLIFVLSVAMIAEFREVLNRDHLRKSHGLSFSDIDNVLVTLTRHAIVLQPPPSDEKAPDPKDQHLWDLLTMRNDLILVTGDKLLLQSNRQGRILSPQQLLVE